MRKPINKNLIKVVGSIVSLLGLGEISYIFLEPLYGSGSTVGVILSLSILLGIVIFRNLSKVSGFTKEDQLEIITSDDLKVLIEEKDKTQEYRPIPLDQFLQSVKSFNDRWEIYIPNVCGGETRVTIYKRGK